MSHPYDPELAPAMPYLPDIDLRDIEGTRRRLAEAAAVLPPYEPGPGVRRETVTVPGADGAPAVPIELLRPGGVGPAPVVVWFHGGGFVLGDAAESLPFLETVVRASGSIAASVQYRRSPESVFPAAIEDGVAAVRGLVRDAERLGIDPDRIAIGGQSAGGALAAGVALRLRDTGGPTLRLLLLDVPVTDDRVSSESARAYEDTPMWSRRNAELSWRVYLGEGRTADAYAAPARASDLSGLPPTFVSVNQVDPLRDEGLEFARRLAQAGVPCEAHLYPGTFHASASIAPAARVSQRQLADIREAFVRALAPVAEAAR
ncbi:alpha/beta hydrolase [Microbacterium resistens]|uniref:alpha/beta hydrolase n=1 Tax=Microbacterium resistens TaxID=156977 RepID=UPI00366E6C12